MAGITKSNSRRALPRIQRGTGITAEFLNGPVDALNELNNAIPKPTGRVTDNTNATDDETGDKISDPRTTFTESSRITSTVRVESSTDASVFVDVDRIDSITFDNQATGQRMTLVFDNT